MVRIIVRTSNYAEGDKHLVTYKTIDIDAPELEAVLRLSGYGRRQHVEVFGAELLEPKKD